MTQRRPRISIIGAGIGGLCLAQGLRQAGFDVAVYERDASASARAQGYRISIDSRGSAALRECLPSPLFQLFEATSGQPSAGATTFVTEGTTLKELQIFHFQQSDTSGLALMGRAVDRLTLRELLLAGLDEAVHFSKEFTKFDSGPGGGVRAHFADGTTASGDLLVGADGVGSRVRQQLLPGAALVDSGVRWLGGRTVLDDRVLGLLPAAMSDRAVWVNDRDHQFFLASVLFHQQPNQAAAQLWPGLRFTNDEDFVMWAIVGGKDSLMVPDARLATASGAQLHRFAIRTTSGGHPMLSAIVEAAAPDRSFFLSIRAVRPVAHWHSSRVTLLGDAIHAGPVNGTGANSALEDAALLSRHLVSAELDVAVHDYEVQMLTNAQSRRSAMEAMRSRRSELASRA